jgi:hypothetical protein
MEDDYRPFEAVKIGFASVETGRERFTRDSVYLPPPLSYWRCNLTALSQHFNLYFVATRDSIAVYKPDFPFQKLQRLPALLIPPALANPHAKGYIDDGVPHAVNHLIVGDLGQEEILLIATDSGNVAAYYTRNIEEAIRKDPYRLSTDARSDHVGVRPFFTHFVQESAWGLAIHSNARMIAVSANTPHHVQCDDPCAKVTVFAFALTTNNENSHEENTVEDLDAENDDDSVGHGGRELDWEDWKAIGVDATPPLRHRNYKITLAGVEGHDHNIPSVSFVNTDDDPDGKWLLSTDIAGDLKIWQIWQGMCQKSWDFAEKRMRSAFFRRREGGWLVAALDPRAFRSASTMDEFCGHSKAPSYHGHNSLDSFDLTHIVRLRTPGNSHAHPLLYESTEDDVEGEDSEYSDSWSNLEEAVVDPHHDDGDVDPFLPLREVLPAAESSAPKDSILTLHNEPLEEQGHGELDQVPPAVAPTTAGHLSDTFSREDMLFEDADDDLATDEDDPTTDEEDVGVDDEDDDIGSPSAFEERFEADDESPSSHQSTTSLSSLAHPGSPPSREIEVDVLSASDMDFPSRVTQSSEKNPHPPTLVNKDSNILKARGTATAPTIPTLHCSSSNLRLLIAPQADSPHLFCANLLKQALPPAFEASNHSHIDRLNMVVQLPEVGMVIVATQLGRCAVCTLTRNNRTGTLGLRVDWILPTKKQELKGLRPVGPLLGIAASPIQGRLHGEHDSSSSDSESDVPGTWGQGGIIDGVTTSFDPVVVVVAPRDEDIDDRQDRGNTSKRKRVSQRAPTLDHHKTKVETRAWKVPKAAEPWQSMDSSRRYRLMLTYLDMTVLTYELARGIERHDVAREEVISTLELLD